MSVSAAEEKITAKSGLLGLDGVSAAEIGAILDETRRCREGTGAELRGIVGNLFMEDSTRTRGSFTIAAYRLGMRTLDITGQGSSASKGESLIDTARNMEALGVDALVIRCTPAGGPHVVAQHVDVPVINAGDGRHEHPTQALLDMLTLQDHWDGEFGGKTVGIVGDIANSRVARSNVFGMTTMGVHVVLCGPAAWLDNDWTTLANDPGSVTIAADFDAILGDLDAVMMLRVQHERHAGATDANVGYRDTYGLTVERAARLRDDVPVMHPGPMNRGVEIDAAVADGPRSVIMQQVSNGVAVRMAVLKRAVMGA